MHGYIQGIEDIAVVGPILKELLDVGVKNDDNLLKLATVFQRIMAKAGNNDDDISKPKLQPLKLLILEYVYKLD